MYYTYEDEPNYFGVIYYRLSQTDYDGTFEQFKIKSVTHQTEIDFNQMIYPTALRSGQEIKIPNLWTEIRTIELMLLDNYGRVIQHVGVVGIGSEVKLSTNNVAPGYYILKGQINGIKISKRLKISA